MKHLASIFSPMLCGFRAYRRWSGGDWYHVAMHMHPPGDVWSRTPAKPGSAWESALDEEHYGVVSATPSRWYVLAHTTFQK